MRVQNGTTGANQVHYLFADHPSASSEPALSMVEGTSLGSSNVSYRSDGANTVVQRYYPWGTVRPGPGNTLPTGYTFTGQLDSGLGLMYYRARHYDPYLNRWIQPDTIVPDPGNPQSLNRYSYVLNNPVRYSDSSGHCGPLTPLCVILALLGTGLLLSGDDTSQRVSAEVANSARLGGALLVTTVGVGSGSAIVGSASTAQAATAGAGAACADGDCTNEAQAAVRALQSAQPALPAVQQTAYEVASSGGRHAGFLQRYSELGAREIARAAQSLQSRANEHLAKLADPGRYAERWHQMTPERQTKLLEFWQKEARTYQEQADILSELLRRIQGQ